MRRQLTVTAVALTAAVTLAGCSGSSGGTHTQSLSPVPMDSLATSSSAPVTSTAPTMPSDPSSSSTARSSGVPTPSVAPSAQGAVNTYIAFYNALTAADRDPAHAKTESLNRYLSGTALTLFDGVMKDQAKAHLAYRGTPDNPRLRVGQVINPSFLFLASCPLASASDPFVQYDVRTGKPVKVNKPTVTVERLISMKRSSGVWRVFSFTAGNKKCTP